MRKHALRDGQADDPAGGRHAELARAEEWKRGRGVRRSGVPCVQDEHDVPFGAHAVCVAVSGERARGDEY